MLNTKVFVCCRALVGNSFTIFSYPNFLASIILASWVECSPMVRETWDWTQVTSYQRLSKWYLIPPCLTVSNIRYVSRVKWSNPGKWVAPSPTTQCSSNQKESLLVANFTYLLIAYKTSFYISLHIRHLFSKKCAHLLTGPRMHQLYRQQKRLSWVGH